MPRLDHQLRRWFGHGVELRVQAGGRRATRAVPRDPCGARGVDLGFNQQIVVAWAVWAPSSGPQRRELAGNYGGGAASATVGVGLGANALIGGSGNTIALQP
jgi:hypothetical protein